MGPRLCLILVGLTLSGIVQLWMFMSPIASAWYNRNSMALIGY